MDARIDEILDYISNLNPDALKVTGFDEAIIGVTSRMKMKVLLAYDVGTIIDILIERDGMTFEEAREYYEFNIFGAWLGEGSPIFIDRDF